MPGTSAKLAYGDTCSLYEMLYALMLPSGNDAAHALAEWGGKAIRKNCSILRKLRPPECEGEEEKSSKKGKKEEKSYLRLFMHHMNKAAKQMHLNATHYANPHGLSNEKAHSTAKDTALLTHWALLNPTFR